MVRSRRLVVALCSLLAVAAAPTAAMAEGQFHATGTSNSVNDPKGDLKSALQGDDVAVDPILLERLDLHLGDRMRIGEKDFTIKAAIVNNVTSLIRMLLAWISDTAWPDSVPVAPALGSRNPKRF